MPDLEASNVVMADPLDSVSASLQEEIVALYKEVVVEMEALVSCHLKPLADRVSEGKSYRRIQPLITELESIQRQLLAIQAFERVKASISININGESSAVTSKGWIALEDEDCPNCGETLEIQVVTGETVFYDQDLIRCTECKFESSVCVDENGYWVEQIDDETKEG